MRLGKLSPILFVGLSLLTAVPALFLRAEESAASLRATRSRQAAEERMAYAKSPAYNPYDTQAGDAGKAISQRLERGETTAAIADATAALARAPYDINLLMLLASAYRDAGNTA